MNYGMKKRKIKKFLKFLPILYLYLVPSNNKIVETEPELHMEIIISGLVYSLPLLTSQALIIFQNLEHNKLNLMNEIFIFNTP